MGTMVSGEQNTSSPAVAWTRIGCEDVVGTAVISGKRGSISSLLVTCTSRFILSSNDCSERCLLLASHWLGSSIHENPFQVLSCTSVNAWKSMLFRQRWWSFTYRDDFKMACERSHPAVPIRHTEFQYHFNDPLLQKWRKSPSSICFRGSSQSSRKNGGWSDSQEGWRLRFLPSSYTFSDSLKRVRFS